MLLFGLLTLLLSINCGGCGGGSSSSSEPYIYAEIISFPTRAVPNSLVASGYNSNVVVEVLNYSRSTPISNAIVTINGINIPYVAGNNDYEVAINVAPAQSIFLEVLIGGKRYSVSCSQFSSYPAVTAPLTWETWSTQDNNNARWVGDLESGNEVYAIGLLDLDGRIVWPSDGSLQGLQGNTFQYTFGPGSLSPGDRNFIVGIASAYAIYGASDDSLLVISGFNYNPVTVANGPPVSLVSMNMTSIGSGIINGSSRQLTVTGTYSDSGTRDLTKWVTWTSSNVSTGTVDSLGLMTGKAPGSVTITATNGGIRCSETTYVYTPSASHPLGRSVAYQNNYAHSGRALVDATLVFPENAAWSVILEGNISYPLVADGKVFVTTLDSSYSRKLYALDQSDGTIMWGHGFSGGSYAGHAYDQGKVFAVDSYLDLLIAYDAATGQDTWGAHLPDEYTYNSPPTAANGIVYVAGEGSGSEGILCAVEESNGHVLWTAGTANGGHSSPTVSEDGVYVSYPCGVHKLDLFTGSSLWHYSSSCSGSIGTTAAYANNLLYVRGDSSNKIFNSATGNVVGNFTSNSIPALSAQAGFFLNGNILQGMDLISQEIKWNFTGDGGIASAPVVINDVVIAGSISGNVYAVDAITGAQIWTGNAGNTISGLNDPTGFGVGEGYLIVPAGNRLTAWRITNP